MPGLLNDLRDERALLRRRVSWHPWISVDPDLGENPCVLLLQLEEARRARGKLETVYPLRIAVANSYTMAEMLLAVHAESMGLPLNGDLADVQLSHRQELLLRSEVRFIDSNYDKIHQNDPFVALIRHALWDHFPGRKTKAIRQYVEGILSALDVTCAGPPGAPLKTEFEKPIRGAAKAIARCLLGTMTGYSVENGMHAEQGTPIFEPLEIGLSKQAAA